MRLGNEFQDKAFPPWFPAGRIVAGVRGGVHLVGAGLAAIFLVMLAAQTVSAQNPANREYLIKAAYLYNLGRYVQWPKASLADANSPFVIGVLEPDPFGESLNVIARTKDLDGRRIEIRRFSRADEINGCHILYLPKAVAEQEAILQRLSGKHILSVGETAEFLPQGGGGPFRAGREQSAAGSVAASREAGIASVQFQVASARSDRELVLRCARAGADTSHAIHPR